MKTYLLRAGLLFLFLTAMIHSLASQSANELFDRGARLLNEGKYEEAIEALRSAMSKDSTIKPQAYFIIGIAYENAERYDKAAESFTYAMKLNYNRKSSGIRLVAVLLKLGRESEACELLRTYPEIKTFLPPEELALVNAMQGDNKEGKKIWADYARKYPNDPLPILRLCELALRENTLDDIRKYIDVLEKMNSMTTEGFNNLIAQLLKKKYFEESERLLTIMFKANPNASENYVALIRLHIEEEKDVDPQVILPPLKTISDAHITACFDLARKYEEWGITDKAIELLNRIVEMKPEFAPAKYEFLSMVYRKGDYQQGIRLLEDRSWMRDILQAAESNADWWYLKAKYYSHIVEQGKREESSQKAVALYRQASAEHPDSLSLVLQISLSYLLGGDASNAERQLKKYLSFGSSADRMLAQTELQNFVNEKVAVQDAGYLMKEYFRRESLSDKEAERTPLPRQPFVRDAIPPQITILSPQPTRGIEELQTDSYVCQISGLASDSQGVSVVYVNGMDAQLSEPSQSEIAQYQLTGKVVKFVGEGMLAPGKNTVEIRAVDLYGNVARRTIEIQRTLPAVTETVPTHKLPSIWAVIVGISQYDARDLRLAFADRDAQSIYGLLKSPLGGAVPDDHIAFLTNRNATRAEVLRAINEKLRLAFDDDEVIIYLACHGVPDEVTNEIYFLCYDSQQENIIGTGISQLDIQKAISTARAKKVVLIVDACHSGGVGLAPNIAQRGSYATLTNKLLQELGQVRDGIAILSASSASEFSQEGQSWEGHGAFTHYLIRGLSGEADNNKNGLITIREVYEYVYRKVADDTGGKQHPNLSGKFDNDLPLSVVK